MALVLTDHNAVFLRMPKTACCWTEAALNAAGVQTAWARSEWWSNRRHCPREALRLRYRHYFTFVRNPWGWYESWWRYQSQPKFARLDLRGWHPQHCIVPLWHADFNQFVRNVLRRYPDGYVTWLYDIYAGRPGGPQCGFVGRYENLQGDLVRILKRLGVTFDREKLVNHPRVNVSDWPRPKWKPALADPARATRELKCVPPFPGRTVWVDASFKIVGDLATLFDHVDTDIGAFLHPDRDCIYAEAPKSRYRETEANRERTSEQIAQYRRDGMPEKFGLFAGGVIARYDTATTRWFNQQWLAEFRKWGTRDQISFNYCRWRHGDCVTALPGRLWKNAWVQAHSHLKTAPRETPANRLMIGCGRQKRSGWQTLDADPRCGADHTGTVPPLPEAVRATRWAEIEMIHFLEHLYEWDARELLHQCYRVLAPGGRLVIECPNLEYCCRVIAGLEQPPRAGGQFDMWGLYGDPNHKNPLFGHRWGWTPATLTAALQAVGFAADGIVTERAKHHQPVRDFRVVATRG